MGDRAIGILPVGNIPFFREIEEVVSSTFCLPAREVRVKVDLTPAYDPARFQFHAGSILSLLRGLDFPFLKVIAVVDVDLYEDGLNFVFGEATLGGKEAVVSVARLYHEDPKIFLSRTLKEVNHELGHTFALTHCTDPSCVMSFSNSILDVDRKGIFPCKRCRSKLNSALVSLGVEPC